MNSGLKCGRLFNVAISANFVCIISGNLIENGWPVNECILVYALYLGIMSDSGT